MLVLFIGLIVVIGGAEKSGLDRWFFERLRPTGMTTLGGLSLAGAVECSQQRAGGHAVHLTRSDPARAAPVVLALAMSTTLAGNLTILGSVANLIVVEGARRSSVRITFGQHLAVGAPVTCVTVFLGVLCLHTLAL